MQLQRGPGGGESIACDGPYLNELRLGQIVAGTPRIQAAVYHTEVEVIDTTCSIVCLTAGKLGFPVYIRSPKTGLGVSEAPQSRTYTSESMFKGFIDAGFSTGAAKI